MPCYNCQKNLGAIDASRFIPCLRGALGLPGSSGSWGTNEHTALYGAISRFPAVQSARGMTRNDIAAIPFGSEPKATAGYAVAYATRALGPDDAFWRCLGTDAGTAISQMTALSGPYYDAAQGAANAISSSEGGSNGSGIPTWAWILGGVALVGGGAYLLTR